MDKIEPYTLVIVAGQVATVQRAERRNGANGYMIADGSAYTRFASDWQVRPARIGDNVCEATRGSCYCGLVHLDPTRLERVRAQG